MFNVMCNENKVQLARQWYKNQSKIGAKKHWAEVESGAKAQSWKNIASKKNIIKTEQTHLGKHRREFSTENHIRQWSKEDKKQTRGFYTHLVIVDLGTGVQAGAQGGSWLAEEGQVSFAIRIKRSERISILR